MKTPLFYHSYLSWCHTARQCRENGRKIKPTQTCFIVTAGRQSFSSSSSDRHTVPDG